MSEQVDYDAYFAPLTLNDEDLDAIRVAEARTLSPDHPIEHTPEPHSHNAPLSRTPPSPDEFDAYDLPEFSPEAFAQIDKLALSVHAPPPHAILGGSDSTAPTRSQIPLGRGSPTGGDGDIKNRSLTTEIALEPDRNADSPHRVKGLWIGRAKGSLYEQFQISSGVLSVTDIVSPSWCEVQFDYGLHQQRHKKLPDRPASFMTAEGKTMNVAHQVAAVNARTVTRGTSVHKALEGRNQWGAAKIEIKTSEERWGLQLVNMLNSLHALMGLGRCREMPVFGIINDQIVTGTIDEIVLQPLHLPASGREEDAAEAAINIEFEDPAPEVDNSSATHTHCYSLHLSDTKTRTHPTLPPEEDAFAGHIQLMLYHCLLSNALSSAQPDIASSQPLDFDVFWQKAGINPARRFSDSFLFPAGLPHQENPHLQIITPLVI